MQPARVPPPVCNRLDYQRLAQRRSICSGFGGVIAFGMRSSHPLLFTFWLLDSPGGSIRQPDAGGAYSASVSQSAGLSETCATPCDLFRVWQVSDNPAD